MLTRLELKNFRNHAQSLLELHPVTLLVGPVGGGKSNLFKAMVMIQNSIHRGLVELFPPGLGEFHWVRTRWAQETDPVGFTVELQDLRGIPDQQARYILQIASSPNGLYVLEETLAQRAPDQPWQWVFERRHFRRAMGEFGNVDPYDPTILNKVWHQHPDIDRNAPGVVFAKEVARALSRFAYYHLETSELKSLGDGQAWDRIEYYGGRLPDFVAWTKSDPEGMPVYGKILKEMRELLPGLQAILVTQADRGQQGIALEFEGHRGYIAAPDLSDGTMFTLGLLCIIHGPHKPAVLCVEEPETGLHPRRLRWLFDRLVGLAYPPPGHQPTQVLISTHSPYLVDFFRDMPESVQVVEHTTHGSRITSLVQIQQQLHIPAREGGIGHEWAMGLFEGL
jgi:energy-coupling factor transporter ATP-binding protein EcfA2